MKSLDTEFKIIASAEKLFFQNGKAGTSMQDIADDAGINRTLLNYYFRTKDQLFEAVFRNALASFVPRLAASLLSDLPIREYIPLLIDTVIDTMLERPQIPVFVLHELSTNPERMPQILLSLGVNPEVALTKMKRERIGGLEMDPRQLIMNVVSLCVFPFAAKPIVSEILYKGDQEAYKQAMIERKSLLKGLMNKLMKEEEP